ncbi:large repetitive protein [Gammaproteobacteria bacterium]
MFFGSTHGLCTDACLINRTAIWRRAVSLAVLITFSSSLVSPAFASTHLDSKSTANKVSNAGSGNNDNNAKSHRGLDSKTKTNKAKFSKPTVSTKSKINNHEIDRYFHRQAVQPEDKPPLSQNKYQPYFEIGGAKYFNQSSSAAGIYDLFVPLLQSYDQLLFTDLRIFDRSGSSFEGNAHVGYRKLYPGTRQLFGIYGAFDCRNSSERNRFNQLTLGLEYWNGDWFIGGNVYKPIGETTKSVGEIRNQELIITGRNITEIKTTNKYYEKALPGADAELGYSITESLTSYVGGYYFAASDANTVAGPKIRLTYDYMKPNGRILGVLDGVSIEAGVQHDKPRGNTAYIGIKLKVGLTNLKKNSNISGFERHMVELVRRDPDVVTVKASETNQKFEKFYQEGTSGFQEGDKPEKSKDFSQWSTEELLKEFGLSEGATYKEVKKRFHDLALKNHPDKGGNSEDFVKISTIYEILGQRLGSTRGMYQAKKAPFSSFVSDSSLGFPETQIHQIVPCDCNEVSKQKEERGLEQVNTTANDVRGLQAVEERKTEHSSYANDLFYPKDTANQYQFLPINIHNTRGFAKYPDVVTNYKYRGAVVLQNNVVVDKSKGDLIRVSGENDDGAINYDGINPFGKINNLNYEYSDFDVERLLAYRILESINQNGSGGKNNSSANSNANLVLTSPVSQNELQFLVKQPSFIERLKKEIEIPKRRLLIPIYLDNEKHWISVLSENRGDFLEVKYFDSSQNVKLEQAADNWLKALLEKVYGEKVIFGYGNALQQSETSVGCGAFAVENAIKGLGLEVSLVGNGLNLSEGDVRKAHYESLVKYQDRGFDVVAKELAKYNIFLWVFGDMLLPASISTNITGRSRYRYRGGNFDYGNKRMGVSRSLSVLANPVLVGSLDTDNSVLGVAVAGNYVYVVEGRVGLKIINIEVPTAPALIGIFRSSSCWGVTVVGNYAYVAAELSGLKIINIANPSAPVLVGNLDTTEPDDWSYGAWGTTVVGKYAYVVNSGLFGRLEIIDITISTTPVLVGSYTTADDSALGVVVIGDYAYVANGRAGLKIINVANPVEPVLIGSLFLGADGIANEVAVLGNYAYVADDIAGLKIIDIVNLVAPVLVGSYITDGSALGVVVMGDYAYVAYGRAGLEIINIANPAAPILVGSYTNGSAIRVAAVGNYAYVAYGSGLKIIRVQDNGALVVSIKIYAAPSPNQPTGVILKNGDVVFVEASGQWCWGGGSDCSIADGTTGRPHLDELPVDCTGSPIGQLIGKISSSGSYFAIGAKKNFTANMDGELLLGQNDRIGYRGDNSGFIIVSITVPLIAFDAAASSTIDAITISWPAVNGVTSYDVSVRGDVRNTVAGIPECLGTSCKYRVLTSGSSYDYSVTAKDGNNNIIGFSGDKTATTTGSVTCSYPSGTTAVVSGTSVIVSWSAVSGATSYDVILRLANNTVRKYASTTNTSYTYDSLTPGTSYIYAVGARNSDGTTGYNPQTVTVKIPSTAFDVIASPIVDAITISWSAVNGAMSYDVSVRGDVRNTVAGIPECLGTSCKYRVLTSGSSYDYSVTAKDGNNNIIGFSGDKTATTTGSVTCSYPSGTTAVVSGTSVIVSWSAVSGATSYDVILRLANNTVRKYASTTNTSYTYDSLTPGTSYIYAVGARNSDGTTGYNAPTPQPVTVPSTAFNATASPTIDSITISWNVVNDAIGYEVMLNGDSRSTTSTNYVYSCLKSGTSYGNYAVRAKNSNGFGDWYTSSESIATTGSTGCSVPSNIIATPMGDLVTISWSEVSGATSYCVLLKLGDTRYVEIKTGLSHVYPGLLTGTTYQYAVSAANNDCSSGYSTAQPVTTKTFIPTGVSASSTKDSITIFWNAVTEAIGYELMINSDSRSTTSTNYVYNCLKSGISYGNYAVRAKRSDSVFGDWYTSPQTIATTGSTGCSIPNNISAKPIDNSVTVSWTEVSGATSYCVLLKLGETRYVEIKTGLSHVYPGLLTGTTYQYAVSAANSECSSGYSAVQTVAVPLVSIPVVPTGVTPVVNGNSLTISWTEVSGATSYSVSVNHDIRNTIESKWNCTNISCIYSGLSPGTRYDYAVMAHNSAGSSDYSLSQWIIMPVPILPTEMKLAKGLQMLSPSLDPTKNWISDTSNVYTYINCINSRPLLVKGTFDIPVLLLRHIFEGLGAQMDVTVDMLKQADVTSCRKLYGERVLIYGVRMVAAQRALAEMVGIADAAGMDLRTWSKLSEVLQKYGEDQTSFDRSEFWKKFDNHFWLLFLAEFNLTTENSDIEKISNFLKEKREITAASPITDITCLNMIMRGIGLPITNSAFGSYPNLETKVAIKFLHFQAGLDNRDYEITHADWVGSDSDKGIWNYLEKFADMMDKEGEKNYIKTSKTWVDIGNAAAAELDIKIEKNIGEDGKGTIIVKCNGANSIVFSVNKDGVSVFTSHTVTTASLSENVSFNSGSYLIIATVTIKVNNVDYKKDSDNSFVVQPIVVPQPTTSCEELLLGTGVAPYEYAQLSLDVYNKGTKGTLSNGWKVLLTSTDMPASVTANLPNSGGSCFTSYFGKAYLKGSNIVIAHSVTDLYSRDDGYCLTLDGVPTCWFFAAYTFVDYSTTYIRDNNLLQYPSQVLPISFTGHSTGGVIAELCAAKYNYQAMVFETPGTLDLMKSAGLSQDQINYAKESGHVIAFNAAPNNCNSVGGARADKVYRIYPVFGNVDDSTYSDNDSPYMIASQPLTKVYGGEYSRQQRKMSGLIKQFNADTGCPKVYSYYLNWPTPSINIEITDTISFGGYNGEVDYSSFSCNPHYLFLALTVGDKFPLQDVVYIGMKTLTEAILERFCVVKTALDLLTSSSKIVRAVRPAIDKIIEAKEQVDKIKEKVEELRLADTVFAGFYSDVISNFLKAYDISQITNDFLCVSEKLLIHSDDSGNIIWGTRSAGNYLISGNGNDEFLLYGVDNVIVDSGGVNVYRFTGYEVKNRLADNDQYITLIDIGKNEIVDASKKGDIYIGLSKEEKNKISGSAILCKECSSLIGKIYLLPIKQFNIDGTQDIVDIYVLVKLDNDILVLQDGSESFDSIDNLKNYVLIKNFAWYDFGIYEYPGDDIGVVLSVSEKIIDIDEIRQIQQSLHKKEVIVASMGVSDIVIKVAEGDWTGLFLMIVNHVFQTIKNKVTYHIVGTNKRRLSDANDYNSTNRNGGFLKIVNFKQGDEIDFGNLSSFNSSDVKILNIEGKSVINTGNFNLTIIPFGYASDKGSPVMLSLNDSNGKITGVFNETFFTVVDNVPVVSAVSKFGKEDKVITFNATDFTSNFADVDGDALIKIQIMSLPSHGALKLFGTDVIINQEIVVGELGNLTFVPDANWNGSTSFSWNGSDGTQYAVSAANVNVTVAAAPVVSAMQKSGTENTVVAFSAADFTSSFSGGSLAKVQILALPSHGILKCSGNNVTINQEIAVGYLGNLTYTPTTNWSGSDSFSWNGSDGTLYATNVATVNITIRAANNLPAISPILKSGIKNTPLVFSMADFTSHFSDIDGDVLAKIQISSLPSNGVLKLSGVPVTVNQEIVIGDLGNLTYVSKDNWSGNDSFNWNGSDGTAYAIIAANVNITIAQSEKTCNGWCVEEWRPWVTASGGVVAVAISIVIYCLCKHHHIGGRYIDTQRPANIIEMGQA